MIKLLLSSVIAVLLVFCPLLLNLLSSPNRKEMVNVTGQHQYQKQQSFVREPFAVQFQSQKTGQDTEHAYTNSLTPSGCNINDLTLSLPPFVLPPLRRFPSLSSFFLSCSHQAVYSGCSAHWASTSRPGDWPALRRLWGSHKEMEQHGEDMMLAVS